MIQMSMPQKQEGESVTEVVHGLLHLVHGLPSTDIAYSIAKDMFWPSPSPTWPKTSGSCGGTGRSRKEEERDRREEGDEEINRQ